MNKLVMPFLKWLGGKRQLLGKFSELLPHEDIRSYCEPFVGGGAMLFHLQPETAFVNDINSELINVYRVIKNSLDELIQELSRFENKPEIFYKVRSWDRDKFQYGLLSNVQKAARIIYLNKTCFNGLYRVNSSGEFNSPFGYYRNPQIINEPVLRAVSYYLNSSNISLSCLDYADVLVNLDNRVFVYLDPPYDPVSDSSSFTGYSRGGFDRHEQIRLRKCCDELSRRGIKFMLSNSATDFIREQYSAYNITVVKAKRAVNSVGNKRGKIEEVVIRNYE
ncbi:MAG: DNA adenine methylase [Synergistaceae bacterium]|nr:DNA adenine methylase [Synergistaceae bacterium]